MEKKEIIRKLKEILSKHEGNTSEGAIYWDFEWVGGKQIPTGGGGYRQEGGKLVYKDKEFYQEMADFILQELDKAREEGRRENYNAQLEEIEMSRNEERKRTLMEVIKLLDARREGGLSEMWVVDEIGKRLKVIKLKDNK